MGAPKTGGAIVGHCVGSERDAKPCGRPLASRRHNKVMGVWANEGHMRCEACSRRQKRLTARRAIDTGVHVPPTVERAVRPTVFEAVDLSWQTGAACAGQDSEPFTRELTTSKIPDDTQAAAWRFCANCPIRERCSSEADKHSDVGLRGGVFRIRKIRGAAAAGSYRKYDVLAGDGPAQRRWAKDAA